MVHPTDLPTVVIVGRPNVGKSALFNRITGQRRVIVGDEPGITRDRIHGAATHDGRRFELVDTGGIADLPAASPGEAPQAAEPIKVAIIGRPNVGKSTLLNALLGQERSIVSPVAGTTRDAVDETVVHQGVGYTFIDTAGIRRKGKTRLMAEKLSVVMARRHIRLAQVVLLVLDAGEGFVGLDATIAGYAHEGGRALILCV